MFVFIFWIGTSRSSGPSLLIRIMLQDMSEDSWRITQQTCLFSQLLFPNLEWTLDSKNTKILPNFFTDATLTGNVLSQSWYVLSSLSQALFLCYTSPFSCWIGVIAVYTWMLLQLLLQIPSLGPFVSHHFSSLEPYPPGCDSHWMGGCLLWVWRVKDPRGTCGCHWSAASNLSQNAKMQMNRSEQLSWWYN